VLCVLGGLLGMPARHRRRPGAASLAGWQTYVTLDALLLAFAFSAGVGSCSACGRRGARRSSIPIRGVALRMTQQAQACTVFFGASSVPTSSATELIRLSAR